MTWNKSNPKRCFIVLCCWLCYQITAVCSPRARNFFFYIFIFLLSPNNFSLYYLQLVTIIIILAHNKQRLEVAVLKGEEGEANETDSNFLHRQFDTVSDNKFYSSFNRFFFRHFLFYFAFFFLVLAAHTRVLALVLRRIVKHQTTLKLQASKYANCVNTSPKILSLSNLSVRCRWFTIEPRDSRPPETRKRWKCLELYHLIEMFMTRGFFAHSVDVYTEHFQFSSLNFATDKIASAQTKDFPDFPSHEKRFVCANDSETTELGIPLTNHCSPLSPYHSIAWSGKCEENRSREGENECKLRENSQFSGGRSRCKP